MSVVIAVRFRRRKKYATFPDFILGLERYYAVSGVSAQGRKSEKMVP